MYDYTFEYIGKPNEITDDFVDRQINLAQSVLIQQLGITLDDIGRRIQTNNVTYDGKLGTRIEHLIGKQRKKLQWLVIFYDVERRYLRIASEIYLGKS
ncbi:hypothetical protein [Flavobacterium selenitireducens]|uniref:hypothetical protein n=1 Tax=Flavobacterium selenitireducens TaxID=2722704 RepID=UPI00168BE716|nr:hypothetical protein [Flavobacterium selenitireducens]MBD3583559.1 hypothetical protein [Flavobacterium selenitireducens]